jgi:hypothetical protein
MRRRIRAVLTNLGLEPREEGQRGEAMVEQDVTLRVAFLTRACK